MENHFFFVENYLVSCGKLSSFLWKTWEWEERLIFSSGWGKDRDRRPLQDPICYFFNFSYLLGGDNFLIHIKNSQNFKPPTKNKSSQTIRIRKKKGKADFVELAELYFPFKINQMVLRCPHLKGGGFTADTLLSHCPKINFFKYIYQYRGRFLSLQNLYR